MSGRPTEEATRAGARPRGPRAAPVVLVAPDAFKESMSAAEAADAVRRGLERAGERCGTPLRIILRPISDGGAGFADALAGDHAPRHIVRVEGPLGPMVDASVRLLPEPPVPAGLHPAVVALIVGVAVAVIVYLTGMGLPLPGNFLASALCGLIAGGLAGLLVLPSHRAGERGVTAAIDMSSASGLALAPRDERDPERTSTHGVGELIRAALDLGAQSILVGVGNSATVDGGAGAAAALGARFFDASGEHIERPKGGDLSRIARIDLSHFDQRAVRARITVACDVDNPLLGEAGAAAVFGPQKGATPAQVARLEEGLRSFAAVCRREGLRADPTAPGAGAAGGLAFGLSAFCKARLARGAEVALSRLGVEQTMREEGVSLALTGEGRLDATSLRGKAALAFARLARDRRIPAMALVGSVARGWEQALTEAGGPLEAVHVITPEGMALDEALSHGQTLLERAAERLGVDWLRLNAGAPPRPSEEEPAHAGTT